MNVQMAIEVGPAGRKAEAPVVPVPEGDGNEPGAFDDALSEAQSADAEASSVPEQPGADAAGAGGRDDSGEAGAQAAAGHAAVTGRASSGPSGGGGGGAGTTVKSPAGGLDVPQPPAQQASASLVDAGRADVPLSPPQVASEGLGAGLQPSRGARTLDTAPWFAVRSGAARARGQALAQALQPALEETTTLATRADQGALRSGSGQTVLGSAVEVQRMVDGKTEVRAPELVARAVTHNAAKGAMLQGKRAGIELPQTVLEAASSSSGDVPVARPEAGEPGPPSPVAQRPAADARPAAPAPGGTAPAATLVPEAPVGVDIAPGTTPADGLGSMARGAAGTAATATDAALAAGRPTEAQLGQVAVPDADHMELKVSDGDRSFRLSVAREADGLNVELKAPREIVAELRALEPDVEAALAEDGYDLASFDAQAEDSQSEAAGQGTEESSTDADGRGGDAPETRGAPVAPAGQGRIINRLA